MAPLESFITPKAHPTHPLHHPTFSPATPLTKILSLLPRRARLTLRLVSHATKSWADTPPSPIRHLTITFPLSHYPFPSAAVFQTLSSHCRHLTVSLLPSATALESRNAKLPFAVQYLESLTHLHIIAPMRDAFYPLLAFRMALQSAAAPGLTCVTVSPLGLEGLMAMRWGPFSSFLETEWMGARVWKGLTALKVGLVPWWGERDGDGGGGGGGLESERERQHARLEQWRTGVVVLHDWLASFAANQKIETLKLWWYEEEGLNPLLLDMLAKAKGNPIWHGGQPVRWKGLKYLWLGKCRVEQKDVDEIRGRCKNLEEFWVEDKWLHTEVAGVAKEVDGVYWTKVYLDDQQQQDVDVSSEAVATSDGDEVYTDTMDLEDYEDDEGSHDQSLEVPFGLDI